ncbi:hypothetical protein [Runella sp.]|uniref:hypothetical protein n=1 Tax=Runella sp. TaxID=1960881 RepID=UPI003D0C939E
MKRLSLAELKAQSGNVVENLEAIKGGNTAECHNGSCTPPPPPKSFWERCLDTFRENLDLYLH